MEFSTQNCSEMRGWVLHGSLGTAQAFLCCKGCHGEGGLEQEGHLCDGQDTHQGSQCPGLAAHAYCLEKQP